MTEPSTAAPEQSWDADDAASRFFRAFCDWELTLPDTLANATGLEKRGPDRVHLDMIYVPGELRSEGWGAKIMTRMIALADHEGVTLTLDPAWSGEEPQPYDLASWYSQFGFKIGSMVRQPNRLTS